MVARMLLRAELRRGAARRISRSWRCWPGVAAALTLAAVIGRMATERLGAHLARDRRRRT